MAEETFLKIEKSFIKKKLLKKERMKLLIGVVDTQLLETIRIAALTCLGTRRRKKEEKGRHMKTERQKRRQKNRTRIEHQLPL